MVVRGNYKQRIIYFEGNSLMVNDLNRTFACDYYVPTTVYQNLLAGGAKLSLWCRAQGGRKQSEMNTDVANYITPYLQPNDIIVLWEGTNDLGNGGLSSADAWANVVTYINSIPRGVKLVICTVIARDFVSDAADLMTRIGEYNTLVRNNASTYGYTVCDLGADPMFDDRADCSVTANYDSFDKVHLKSGGNTRVVSLMTTAVQSIL